MDVSVSRKAKSSVLVLFATFFLALLYVEEEAEARGRGMRRGGGGRSMACRGGGRRRAGQGRAARGGGGFRRKNNNFNNAVFVNDAGLGSLIPIDSQLGLLNGQFVELNQGVVGLNGQLLVDPNLAIRQQLIGGSAGGIFGGAGVNGGFLPGTLQQIQLFNSGQTGGQFAGFPLDPAGLGGAAAPAARPIAQ